MNLRKTMIIGSMLLIILVGYSIYDYKQKDLKEQCTNPNSLSYINICMQRGNLYHQEQYDAYYNVAKNNPSLSILKDEEFYHGFRLAYNNCDAYSTRNECNLRDKKVRDNFEYNCTANTDIPLLCTDSYFRDNLPNKENLKYFIKIVETQIQKNKVDKFYKYSNCNLTYQKFYNNIEKDLINLVPLEVKEACK